MNNGNVSWYKKVQYKDGAPLEQGDILFNCPYFNVTEVGENGDAKAKTILYNVLILSQSCDIANGKIDKIFVAPLVYLSEVFEQKEKENGQELGKDKKKNFFKQLSSGKAMSHYLLDEDANIGLEDYLVVDFSNSFTISLSTMKELANQQEEIIRLISPYKEHLSQAFARFFMRVGLPNNLINPFGK